MKNPRVDLGFWDPHRLAADVLATLSLADQREKATDLVLKRDITGSFFRLVRYARHIEGYVRRRGRRDSCSCSSLQYLHITHHE